MPKDPCWQRCPRLNATRGTLEPITSPELPVEKGLHKATPSREEHLLGRDSSGSPAAEKKEYPPPKRGIWVVDHRTYYINEHSNVTLSVTHSLSYVNNAMFTQLCVCCFSLIHWDDKLSLLYLDQLQKFKPFEDMDHTSCQCFTLTRNWWTLLLWS